MGCIQWATRKVAKQFNHRKQIDLRNNHIMYLIENAIIKLQICANCQHEGRLSHQDIASP